jgi:hypothetical protein
MPPPFTNDPSVAAYLRELEDKGRRQDTQMQSLMVAYDRMRAHLSGNKAELRRLSDALAKAAKRIRYIEDIPGKRVPYFLNFEIEFPGPDSPSTSAAGQQRITTQPISQDGPFVCTTYLSAMLMKTYSIGPVIVDSEPTFGRPGDPPAGTEVISPLTGRFRPVASTADPFSGAYIGARVGPITVAGAQAVQTFRPGTADFLFEIFDASVDRNRQNGIPIPSRYIFSEFDRPLYLPISDFFSQSAVIQFKATLTRNFGFAEVNYAALPGGFAEGLAQPPPNPAIPDDAGRQVLALGGTLYFCMLGYKILQAQSPAT